MLNGCRVQASFKLSLAINAFEDLALPEVFSRVPSISRTPTEEVLLFN